MPRDYALTGPMNAQAQASGLASAVWYSTPVDRKVMKTLMQRSDKPALRDTVILFAAAALSAAIGIALYPNAWSVPFWLIYGVIYGSAMDSRWHECGHGTAFRTRWMNRWLYQVASFCMMRNPECWKFSHFRHHSDTVIVGRDPEIAIMRPVKVAWMLSNLVGLPDVIAAVRRFGYHVTGRLHPEECDYLPETSHAAAFRAARVWAVIYGITIAAALFFQSWIPLLLIGLPRLYGCWHMVMCGWLQHGGLADDVTDHRLNSRTVCMNRISRFIYWNMNYHVEHHMFPLVPYHRLPDLHREIAWDLPKPNSSIATAYTEMIPAILRQRHDPDFHICRPLPPTANPYQVAPGASAH